MLFIGVCFLGFLAHILAEENLHINMDLTGQSGHGFCRHKGAARPSYHHSPAGAGYPVYLWYRDPLEAGLPYPGVEFYA
jgi:hypothetical protein